MGLLRLLLVLLSSLAIVVDFDVFLVCTSQYIRHIENNILGGISTSNYSNNYLSATFYCPILPNCRSCNAYDINIDAHLPVPIAPCNEYRCIYLLHHPKSNGRKHVFLASTLTPNTGTTGQTRQETTIAKHLSMGEIRWQILTLIPGTYSPPYRTTNPKITEWRRKITKQVEDVIIHEEPWSRSFYNELDVEFRQNNQVT